MKICITTFFTIFFLSCNGQTAKDTEIWEPIPKEAYSISDSAPPDDAIVLFDGSNLDKWVHKNGKPAKWDIKDGYFTVKPGTGDILSKEAFGSCQLHVEFMSPIKIEGKY